MNREIAEKVANAVLYEGYMLYPYRRSAIKNRQRWTFGILYPPAYQEVRAGTERSQMHSEVLLRRDGELSLDIQLRFLHLVSREAGDEGVERSVRFHLDEALPHQRVFSFPGTSTDKMTQREVNGTISVAFQQVQDSVFKVIIDVMNKSPLPAGATDRDSALLCSLLSAHTILAVNGGEFVSLLDPPDDLRDAVRACNNIGNFPVIVGNEGERDMMLCSPIVLYDYPQIAPESAGDFYDATEMDEMLTLRVMTLTDEEKDEMRLADDHVRKLLERTQSTAREQLMRTHGTIRSMRPVSEKP